MDPNNAIDGFCVALSCPIQRTAMHAAVALLPCMCRINEQVALARFGKMNADWSCEKAGLDCLVCNVKVIAYFPDASIREIIKSVFSSATGASSPILFNHMFCEINQELLTEPVALWPCSHRINHAAAVRFYGNKNEKIPTTDNHCRKCKTPVKAYYKDVYFRGLLTRMLTLEKSLIGFNFPPIPNDPFFLETSEVIVDKTNKNQTVQTIKHFACTLQIRQSLKQSSFVLEAGEEIVLEELTPDVAQAIRNRPLSCDRKHSAQLLIGYFQRMLDSCLILLNYQFQSLILSGDFLFKIDPQKNICSLKAFKQIEFQLGPHRNELAVDASVFFQYMVSMGKLEFTVKPNQGLFFVDISVKAYEEIFSVRSLTNQRFLEWIASRTPKGYIVGFDANSQVGVVKQLNPLPSIGLSDEAGFTLKLKPLSEVRKELKAKRVNRKK